MSEQVIGIIYRHGFNDYEFIMDNLTEEDSNAIEEIMARYANICGMRGDRNMTLEEGNVGWIEGCFETRYRNTANPIDIVTIKEIFKRYVDINGTYCGFEEYVDSGFMNGNEKEYEEVKQYE